MQTKREVCIEDIASFVEEKSRALSNPIFGKLPFLAKDKKKSQMRGTKSKPEGSGPGPRELSNFSTTTVGPATALPIVLVKVRAQGSPFCIETCASWIRVLIPFSALTCFWIVLALKASI